jgi:hypothetical protein
MDEIYNIPRDTLFPKLYTKQKVTHTVRADILHEFNALVESNGMNRSGVIEKFMEIFIKNMNTKK